MWSYKNLKRASKDENNTKISQTTSFSIFKPINFVFSNKFKKIQVLGQNMEHQIRDKK